MPASDDIDPHAPTYNTPTAGEPSADSASSGFMDGLFSAASGVDEPTVDIDAPEEPTVDIDAPETPETPETPEVAETPAEIDTTTDPDFADAPEIRSTANKIGWKELKSRKAAVERELNEARGELERLRKAPVTPANSEETVKLRAELEDHRKQLADYDSKMALVDVEKSREYRTTVAEPLERAESLIQAFAAKYDMDVAAIAKAATEPNVLDRNQLLSDLVTGMNDFDKFEFKKVVDEAKTLYTRSVQVKANAKQALASVEQSRQKETAEANARKAQEVNATADELWGGLTERMGFLKEDATLARQLNDDARGADLLSAPPDTQMYAKYAAVVLPTLMDKYEAMSKEFATLKQSLAKRTAASPAARGGAVSTAAPATGGFMDGLDSVLGTSGRG